MPERSERHQSRPSSSRKDGIRSEVGEIIRRGQEVYRDLPLSTRSRLNREREKRVIAHAREMNQRAFGLLPGNLQDDINYSRLDYLIEETYMSMPDRQEEIDQIYNGWCYENSGYLNSLDEVSRERTEIDYRAQLVFGGPVTDEDIEYARSRCEQSVHGGENLDGDAFLSLKTYCEDWADDLQAEYRLLKQGELDFMYQSALSELPSSSGRGRNQRFRWR